MSSVRTALAINIDPREMIEKGVGVAKGLRIVGGSFERGEALLADLASASDTAEDPALSFDCAECKTANQVPLCYEK